MTVLRRCLLVVVLALAVGDANAQATSVPFQRGMTVGEWGPSAYAPKKTRALLRSLARERHVDSVTLFVVWMQRDRTSTTIAPASKTAPRANLVKAIRAARAAGLKVVLRPYVERADGGWRGEIKPASVGAWFAAYKRFVLTYAALAQREHVTGLVVGTEMVSLSRLDADWRALVASVRHHFHGFVTYQANWDEVGKVKWLDALDVISVSGYYPVATRPGESVPQLVSGWTRWFGKLQALHAQTGRPVMFGEIGYRTVTTAAVTPWDIEPAPFSASAQRNAYDAALRVWYRVPWFAGFHWWYLAPQRYLTAQRKGGDHRPTQATLQLVARWYAQRRGAPR
jgi:hypothetical protein